MELSRFCIAAWSLIEAAQRKYPKQSMKSFTCIIGQFLPQFFFPFDTVEDLMIAISFLVQKGLEEDCVADIFNFSISKNLRIKSTVSDVVKFYNKHYKSSTDPPLTVYLQPWLQCVFDDKASPSPPAPSPPAPSPPAPSPPAPSPPAPSPPAPSPPAPSPVPPSPALSSPTLRKPAVRSLILRSLPPSSLPAPSPVLPSPPPPSATLQPPALRKAALRSPVLRNSALQSPALRKAALRSPVLRNSALQSPALRKAALRSPPAPSPAPPSQPCYKPTHYTSTSVPLTNDTDNSKGFLERYQVFFENKSPVPLDYNKYPGLNQAYHKASKLNFIYDTGVNHCNGSRFYRSRSRLMVVLPPEIQTLIGIFPLIEESKEAITLDRFAFLTVCNRKCISVESLRQSTKAKVLKDVIKATLESFYDQQVIFEDNVSSPELVLIWITKFWGKSNTLIQRTINGVHNTCCTGKMTGIWIGQDGLIFLDIRGDSGPWMRWLNVFDYNVEWNLKTAS
ncbi:hypothetical protein BTUL_0253g00040 [Botrytis tulipae]|uniref:Uncharacterized protein n=1 Tax=Botrytis tulipae TaxID=87230 RepID=A0A4Z1EAT6_9HELO|nr:hypothetical protein BTUL_0253g00040 [Botrytis tulipae]